MFTLTDFFVNCYCFFFVNVTHHQYLTKRLIVSSNKILFERLNISESCLKMVVNIDKYLTDIIAKADWIFKVRPHRKKNLGKLVSLSENIFVDMLCITSYLLAIQVRFSKRQMFLTWFTLFCCFLTFIAWIIPETQIRKLDHRHVFSPFITEKSSLKNIFAVFDDERNIFFCSQYQYL